MPGRVCMYADVYCLIYYSIVFEHLHIPQWLNLLIKKVCNLFYKIFGITSEVIYNLRLYLREKLYSPIIPYVIRFSPSTHSWYVLSYCSTLSHFRTFLVFYSHLKSPTFPVLALPSWQHSQGWVKSSGPEAHHFLSSRIQRHPALRSLYCVKVCDIPLCPTMLVPQGTSWAPYRLRACTLLFPITGGRTWGQTWGTGSRDP